MRSDLKAFSYAMVGWWLPDVLSVFLWVVPLFFALIIGVTGLVCAYSLNALKAWWSEDEEDKIPLWP